MIFIIFVILEWNAMIFRDFHESQLKLYDFHDFEVSLMEFYDFHDFHDSRLEL